MDMLGFTKPRCHLKIIGEVSERMEDNTKRSAFEVMLSLIELVKPLAAIMALGILLGTIGNLCAIFIPVLGVKGVMQALVTKGNPFLGNLPFLTKVLVCVAVLRGVFHYGEQYCNHYIAFRLLALIRSTVFDKLRALCPAKLEDKEKGNLISMITTDIEMLEVFFAHTISPIVIAAIVSVIMTIFIGVQFWLAGIIAFLGYILVGVVIPISNEKKSSDSGYDYRNDFGSLTSFLLSSVYGLQDILQYGHGDAVSKELDEWGEALEVSCEELADYQKNQRSLTQLVVQGCSVLVLLVVILAYMRNAVDLEKMITAVVATMSSFGPVIALSSLSNNLNQTLASGNRILELLDEDPSVPEKKDGVDYQISDESSTLLQANKITFAYDDVDVLKNMTVAIPRGKVIGIHGASGCGKSTFIRLLMRFWDVDAGRIVLADKNVKAVDIKSVNTSSLRENQSYVTQETWISHDTIANNILYGKPDATLEEVKVAAQKANIHNFIMSLPEGYETMVGEMGSTLSGGEKQRIGLARAFLHDSPIMFLDEPTSSLDALNEGMILKSLKEEAASKTLVIVSHRKSTMRIANKIIDF